MANVLDHKRLKELRGLADLAYQVEAGKMRELTVAEHNLRSEVEELRRNRSAQPSSDVQTFLMVGGDRAWAAWTDRRLRQVQNELARLLVRIEKHRAVLARSFGKVQALDRLSEKQN